MQFRQSLRFRITFSFTLFAALLSSAIAYGVYLTIEDIEHELIDEQMQAELEYLLQQPQVNRDALQQITFDTRFYYQTTPAASNTLPPALHTFAEGLHSWQHQQQSSYVLIMPFAQGRAYLIKEATEFENREQAISAALILVVLLSLGCGFILGRTLASRVISPVASLAQQVADLTPGQDSSTLTKNYAHDEVGQLARTFAQYQQRMQHFIEREQAFTSDASHELRTPLAIIQGAAELLQECEQIGDKQQRQLQRIRRAAERMSQMLEVLLMLARETSNPSAAQSSSAQEVILDAVEQYRHLIGNKTINLHTHLIEDFTITLNKSVLSIVLGNIIKNAIEYTEQGQVEITLQPHQITVSDTGCGISAEDQQHIFTRFYRANPGKPGNGIGLAIVKRICDRQGWQIQLDSTPGQGTTVTLDFNQRSTEARQA